MQCTSPLVQSEDIERGIQQFTDNGLDSLFSASRFHGFVWKVDDGGKLKGVNHSHSARVRRQDRQDEFYENGAFYILNVEKFLRAGHRFFGKIGVLEMPVSRCIEVDTQEDLEIASILLKEQRERKRK